MPALLTAVGQVPGADERIAALTITGASELDTATPSELALAASKPYLELLRATSAGAVIVSRELLPFVPADTVPILADEPHILFVSLLERLYPGDTRASVKALVDGADDPVRIEDGARIGANVSIGGGVEIGSGTYVAPGAVIGPNVKIGRDCTIAAGASIECAYLGDRVVLHAGARIGIEGFGWLDFGRSNRKIPQLGRVVLQDGVEVGANTTIDRGALGDTVVGEGTKIDNLVQVGHNCKIGRRCLIAAQSCLSGSTVIGDGVQMAPGSFTSGHLTIGAGSVVHVRALVTKSLPPGSDVFGAPAVDIKRFWREAATLRRLTRGGRRE